MNIYAILMHVGEKQLPTVLSALAGAATLVSITPTQPDEKKPRTGYVNGKKNKGIRGNELALAVLSDNGGIATYQQIAARFEEQGFSCKSASPCLSNLVTAGKVRRLGKGKFALPGTTIHK